MSDSLDNKLRKKVPFIIVRGCVPAKSVKIQILVKIQYIPKSSFTVMTLVSSGLGYNN